MRLLGSDDVRAVIKNMVNSLGGAAATGKKLWPDKSVEAAEQRLLHCCNEKRSEKLSAEELFMIVRWCRDLNIHIFADYFARNFDYEIREITREEKAAKLADTVQALTVALQSVAQELAKLK